jgi:glycosyltransferase 2 family protein
VKRYVVPFLKVAVPVAIIAWLLTTISPDEYEQFMARPKNWPLLLGALVVVFTAVTITIIRWYLLVRALHLRFSLTDAFRLGFLGYLFNFVVVGSVGGDLFKAIFIAREQAGRRAEAVATVLVDRIVGMYGLVVLTAAVILLGGVPKATVEVELLCQLTLVAAAVGALGIAVLFIPGFTTGPLARFCVQLPKVGAVFEQLLSAVRIYRSRWPIVIVTVVMSVGSHSLFTLSLFLIARAMFDHVPTLHEHMILVPLGMVAGALPLAPGGFGAFELAIEALYKIIPAAPDVDVAGVLVALVYHLLTVLVAMIGVVIYWTSRNEFRRLRDEA